MDPAVFSPNRLDGLIHIEMFKNWQQQEKVSISLHSKCSRYFILQPKNHVLMNLDIELWVIMQDI